MNDNYTHYEVMEKHIMERFIRFISYVIRLSP